MRANQREVQWLLFAWPVYTQEDFCPGATTQAVVDQLLEVAPARRFAVDVGDQVSYPDASQMGRSAGHELPDHNLSVGPGDAINADTAEIGGGVTRSGRQGDEQYEGNSVQESDHLCTITQSAASVNGCTDQPTGT